ncbi:acetyl-CoA carboxylase biotin carboxyl carrier protein [Terrilactibacillus sp. BCM23-1]|uniref:Biotin carboxyl carrier protein of acetyl-CoA carboxylase n=1 Tax=Terrilactibacillus tamarindi TaxID=2599694 RepID=A0A6N8CR93_9BACI|nr:acetyl-CoA carboxylase biotin carboxyl carrier protein [Terrilactibacillus tamarindi]MTT32684.1 acetyl-CoA carboxylase biotin carboxyl carrier protein [Terrilactibacillus tamarindi]
MLKIEDIRELIKVIDDSSINEFEYEEEGTKISLRKQIEGATQVVQVPSQSVPALNPVHTEPSTQEIENTASTSQVEDTVDQAKLHTIESPMVGTFYASSNPDSEAFVQKGSKVNKDTVVCIVEAMKLFNEIEADVKGEIVDVLVENGQLVEFGQPLFVVKED